MTWLFLFHTAHLGEQGHILDESQPRSSLPGSRQDGFGQLVALTRGGRGLKKLLFFLSPKRLRDVLKSTSSTFPSGSCVLFFPYEGGKVVAAMVVGLSVQVQVDDGQRSRSESCQSIDRSSL